jgi:ABC-type xylose transport system substrate-binding protein
MQQMTEHERMIHNEQVKLAATFCNNLAVGAFIAGGLGPAVALYLQQPNHPHNYIWMAATWSVSALMHFIAKATLRNLK